MQPPTLRVYKCDICGHTFTHLDETGEYQNVNLNNDPTIRLLRCHFCKSLCIKEFTQQVAQEVPLPDIV